MLDHRVRAKALEEAPYVMLLALRNMSPQRGESTFPQRVGEQGTGKRVGTRLAVPAATGSPRDAAVQVRTRDGASLRRAARENY